MKAAIAIIPLLVSACGEDTMIVLEVHSDLSIPDQVDALEIVLSSPVDGGTLKTVDLDLKPTHDFPLDVGFYPNDTTPTVLEGRIIGELSGAPVARLEVVFNWQVGKLNRVELFPLEPL